ncbi:GNAT family N-acetyltransferase [Mumia sp. zg.B17]|nr:GNAT family N-acetyltransferase [Mumia sp. zg.B17]
MTTQIHRADFADPGLSAFLQAHLDDLAPTAPACSRHALDLDGLRRPSVRMWVACDGDQIVGTAALAELEPEHEELKSMRTDPRHRGRGVARGLLTHLLADARDRGGPTDLAGDGEHGVLRACPRAVRLVRLRRVRPLRLLPRGPEQHVHDARDRRDSGRLTRLRSRQADAAGSARAMVAE